jgi:hypothetical protein
MKFRFLNLFDQKYNIVIYIRESSNHTAEFMEFAEKIILINNRTKWNN